MYDLAKEIQRKLGKKRLFYVCRDAERAAAGLLLGLPNFFVVTNDSSYARELKKRYKNIIICHCERSETKRSNPTTKEIASSPRQSGSPRNDMLDTRELLSLCHSELSEESLKRSRRDPSVANRSLRMTIRPGDLVMVFKPTAQIEKICTENGWQLLNPSAELANRVEEKISQVEWLGPLKKYLPEYKIAAVKNIRWTGRQFILQFAHAHTGSGTMLVKNKKQLDELKQKFPDRPARTAKYISGPLFTNNNVVWPACPAYRTGRRQAGVNKVLIGNINYQITGLKPFTNRKFATIGNDWQLPKQILTAVQIKQYKTIATDVGKKLARAGWKGLFGIDVVVDEKTGRLYLVEINARQPASTTYESELQHMSLRGVKNDEAISMRSPRSLRSLAMTNTFTAHLAALLGLPPQNFQLTPITAAAQIIQRVGSTGKKIRNYWRIIKYDNTNPGADKIRYQFLHGIMSRHNKLSI